MPTQDVRLERLEHTVYGNGRDGLTVRIDRTETQIDNLFDALKEQRLAKKEAVALYITLFCAALSLLATLIPWLLNHI